MSLRAFVVGLSVLLVVPLSLQAQRTRGSSAPRAGRLSSREISRRISGRPFSYPNYRFNGYGLGIAGGYPGFGYNPATGILFRGSLGATGRDLRQSPRIPDGYTHRGARRMEMGYQRYAAGVTAAYVEPYLPPRGSSADIASGASQIGAVVGTTVPGVYAAPPKNSVPESFKPSSGAPDIAQAGHAVLFSPKQNGGEVHYRLNGQPYTMRPNQSQPVELNERWTISFDRGNGSSVARYTLSEGIYKFTVRKGRWELVQVTGPAPPREERTPQDEGTPEKKTSDATDQKNHSAETATRPQD